VFIETTKPIYGGCVLIDYMYILTSDHEDQQQISFENRPITN